MNTSKLIALFLAVFAITSYADTAAQLAATIEAYEDGGLTATVDENTVTVTGGTKTDFYGLALNIDAGVSVIWQAELTTGNAIGCDIGNAFYPSYLICIAGAGSFEVQSGTVSATTGNAVYVDVNVNALSISGGKILAKDGYAVYFNKVAPTDINGGVFFAYGNSADDVIEFGGYEQSTGNAIIVWLPKLTATYGQTLADLPSLPTGWAWQSATTTPVGNAGTPSHEATYNNIFTVDVTITVNKAKITKPVAPAALTYSGSPQTAAITTNPAYTITGNTGTDPGSYTATVALNDKANYEWATGGTADLKLSWTIEEDPTPIRQQQLASRTLKVQTIGNYIVLENLPQNAKVDVYNLQGKLIFSSGKSLNRENRGSDNMRIPVQTKGMYIVRIK